MRGSSSVSDQCSTYCDVLENIVVSCCSGLCDPCPCRLWRDRDISFPNFYTKKVPGHEIWWSEGPI